MVILRPAAVKNCKPSANEVGAPMMGDTEKRELLHALLQTVLLRPVLRNLSPWRKKIKSDRRNILL